jgi:dipeptidyl aminopeptidase/acylaminoacyl peptidase
MRLRSSSLPAVFLLVCALAVFGSAAGQAQSAAFTAQDYARAERFLAQGVNDLVVGGAVTPSWLDDDRFWYRTTTAGGSEFLLVDPAQRTRAPLFDHARLAAALSSASGQQYSAEQLPFTQIELSPDRASVSFALEGRRWSCDVRGNACHDVGAAPSGEGRGGGGGGGRGGGTGGGGGSPPVVNSPDGRRAAFIRDWNLWMRDLATGQEKALTTDGLPDFGYATDNAGWAGSDRAMVLWSPDSRKIATQQQDERNVGMMFLASTTYGHPTLRAWKYPLPGDTAVAMLHRVIIDVETGAVTRLQTPPDYHRGSVGDNIRMGDYQWSPDASQLAFVSVSRDHKQAVLRVADARTGVVRDVLEETVATHYESRAQWQVLWGSNEVIWYSERDNWGHLYLYDLNTGRPLNQITTGPGPVQQILKVDEKERILWFGAQGREPAEDPYFRHFYRIDLDGTGYVPLTPEVGNHAVQQSPSGRYLIDTYSQPDVPPVVTLRDRDGRLVMELERADISKLLATGWKPPIPIKMTASDGMTDIYGLMFVPSNLDPNRKYPIINHIYPGPQSGSTGSRSFSAARGDRQSLAELGFVVVTIDGMGTPGRSKSFQDTYYGAMGRHNTIPDQIAGMKQLAERYPYIDLGRVGIWGHSGGGFATTSAMFRYPDFFDVGIAESGNHDQRAYEDDWGERYQGLLAENSDGTDNYTLEANQEFAKNLTGKLLLAHGTMDNNVPPYNTYLVVDALIRANKDFDLLMIPNAGHGYGSASNYMMRRRWDYFVRWLLDAEPPKEFVIGVGATGG